MTYYRGTDINSFCNCEMNVTSCKPAACCCQGVTGPTGPTGPAGPAGGPIGPTGATGATAPSIYAQQGKCRNHAAFSTLKTIKHPL